MSNNSQTLDDLRYCADNFVEHHDEVVSNLREFAASLIGAGISPPAQKPVSELGGSGAGLVGNPEFVAYCIENGFDVDSKLVQLWFHQGNRATLQGTMSGDAWESAACHVLTMRGQAS